MQSQQTLELRQRQQLALTPELQQSIRFLQLSAIELSQELAQVVLENPMLESGPDYEVDEYGAGDVDMPALTVDWTGAGRRRANRDEDDDYEWAQPAAAETLQDYLLRQLSLMRADERDNALVQALVYELDQDGYLLTPIADIVAYLQQYTKVRDTEVYSALTLLQTLEPAGVGARNLSESLELQLDRLQRRGHADVQDPEILACARRIVSRHLELLASGNLIRLRQVLGCDSAVLKKAHALVLALEPRPAGQWADNVADYVVPDVFVRKVNARWQVTLNPAVVPRVRVHRTYSRLLEQAGQGHAALREKLQQARGLVKTLHHRGDTILRVSQAIVAHQQDYLDHGAQAMRPLVLRDIATKLELHESTVHRATRFKYAQTPQGVIELRAFFGSTLGTQDGGSTSASAVQFMITRIVENESQIKPLSDSKIAALLEEKGVTIARRTVAKYRETAGIEPAIRRKARYTLGQ